LKGQAEIGPPVTRIFFMRKSTSGVESNAQAPTVLSDAETDHVAGGDKGGVADWRINTDGNAWGGGTGAPGNGNGLGSTVSNGRFGAKGQ
jgi:hypothetical protein